MVDETAARSCSDGGVIEVWHEGLYCRGERLVPGPVEEAGRQVGSPKIMAAIGVVEDGGKRSCVTVFDVTATPPGRGGLKPDRDDELNL